LKGCSTGQRAVARGKSKSEWIKSGKVRKRGPKAGVEFLKKGRINH